MYVTSLRAPQQYSCMSPKCHSFQRGMIFALCSKFLLLAFVHNKGKLLLGPWVHYFSV